jgi:hypothetical protein
MRTARYYYATTKTSCKKFVDRICIGGYGEHMTATRTVTGTTLAECEAQLEDDEKIVHITGSRVTGHVRCIVKRGIS